MKVWIRSTRGPETPGGLVVEARIEIELADGLLPDGAEDVGDHMTAAAAACALAVNRQFAKPGKATVDLVEDASDSYESAVPVRPVVLQPAPAPPFDEFSSGGASVPPRPVRNEAPPRPARPERSGGNGRRFNGPPKTAGQLLGWLKDKPDLKKRAEAIGEGWGIGSWLKAWKDEDAVDCYHALAKEQSAGFGHTNGTH
jgi:hypothetical protein